MATTRTRHQRKKENSKLRAVALAAAKPIAAADKQELHARACKQGWKEACGSVHPAPKR